MYRLGGRLRGRLRLRICTSGPDRLTYAAMYDFGDSLLFLAILGRACLRPAPLFLPVALSVFWKVSSMGALAMAGPPLQHSSPVWRRGVPYMVGLGSAQVFLAPLLALLFLLSAVRSDAFVQAHICDRHRDRGDALRLRVLHGFTRRGLSRFLTLVRPHSRGR